MKYKESGEIKFHPLPEVSGFRHWKTVVYTRVTQAAGRPDDKALKWVRRVEDPRYPDDFFIRVPLHFASLSRKITVAIQSVVKGSLQMRFDLVVDGFMKRNESTPGLYLLRLILKEFATNRNTDIIYQITDLQRVSVHNNNLEEFLNLWDLILGQMHAEDRPNARHLQH